MNMAQQTYMQAILLFLIQRDNSNNSLDGQAAIMG